MLRSLTRAAAGILVLAAPLHAQLPQTDGPFMQAFIFGDALFTVTDRDVDDGFKLGQMVGHANASLSQNLVFFGEVSVTARSSGYSLAMERAIIRYEFSDPLKLSTGRYHTPISFWNTEFHHGLWLQGSVARPEAIKFGSRYIPVHFVGFVAEGNLNTIPLHYSAGFGNGRTESLAGAGDAGDVNGRRAFIVSASIRPRNLFGFRVGGALYGDRISQGGVEFADELIASGHVVWNRGAVEAIAEVIHVSHSELGTDESMSSPSWYGHVGYRLGGALSDFTPYVRYEDMDIDETDPVFTGFLADYEAVVAGVRFDFEDFAALKGEYRNESFAGADGVDSWFVQASFAIPISGGS